MKRLSILAVVAAILIMVPVAAFAQSAVYAHVQAGTVLKRGQLSEFSFVTAGDIPIATDTLKKYVITERAGYFYADRKEQTDVKAAYSVICGTKYFDIGSTKLNLTLGSGAIIEAQDAGKTMPAFKAEIGATVFKAITFSVGTDYMIVDTEPDRVFFYAGIDLLP